MRISFNGEIMWVKFFLSSRLDALMVMMGACSIRDCWRCCILCQICGFHAQGQKLHFRPSVFDESDNEYLIPFYFV